MSAEIINLDQRRKEKWLRTLETARSMGRAVLFNMELEEPAKVLQFPTERQK